MDAGVAMDRHDFDARERDSVGAELDSMRQIAQAIEQLRDPDVRQRVLRWANERYGVTAAAPLPGVMHVARPAVAEPMMAIEELQDLFEPRPAEAGASAAAPARPRGVESMVKDFAADFRRLALEWQSV